MILYDANSLEHGLVLAQWWSFLHESGDINKLFSKNTQSLQGLYKLMEPPTILGLDVDEHGVWFAAWVVPTLDGAFMNLWIREDMRKTRIAAETVVMTYDAALMQFPVLMGITISEDLLPVHRLVGYTIMGKIPHLFDGKPAWLVVLTREDFAAHRQALLDKGKTYGN